MISSHSRFKTILAHRDYWLNVRKLEDNLPRLRYGIINLHPSKQDYLPSDYDGVVDRKNDIIYHDRTEHNLMKMLQYLCLIS